MSKIYTVIFPSDRQTQAFYDRSNKAATLAGGELWTSLNFDSPSTNSQALLQLPDEADPNTVLPLPAPAVWTLEDPPAA